MKPGTAVTAGGSHTATWGPSDGALLSTSNATGGGPIRVYTADSRPLCLRGVADVLSGHEDIVLVGSALTWDAAAREIADLGPDIALIKDSLAGSCSAALVSLHSMGAAARVVFLTDSVETATVYEAMAGRAAGYVTTADAPEMLVRAVREVFGGRTALTLDLQTRLAEEIRARTTGDGVALSARELRTLQLIADGVPTKEIAPMLAVSSSTIKSDLSSIFAKLRVHDRAAAVAEGVRKGFVD